MANKLLSIIVLNWNRLHYTKQTIECLIKKTTVPHEFIFVDNNSTEKSGVREYLSDMANKTNADRVELVFNKRNYGVAGGRNTGLMVAKGDYLFNIDDDVLVPEKYDVFFKDACDRVPKLGLTGINVEPNKYQIVDINGVKLQMKSAGNLGGAALCMPRRTFSITGFYGYGRNSLYGHEDSFMKYKLNMLHLISAYIVPMGIHLDKESLKSGTRYRRAKNDAHVKNSAQLRELSKSIVEMRNTGNVYTPFNPDKFDPVDDDIFTNEILNEVKKEIKK